MKIYENDDRDDDRKIDFFQQQIGIGFFLTASEHINFLCLDIAKECQIHVEENELFSKQLRTVIVKSLPIIERVVSISTSISHTLLLTSFGSVYSCGDSSDGQLGHGNDLGCQQFRVVDWFSVRNIVISKIAAGADRVRSHSAAISSEGELYTWGNAAICGHSLQETRSHASAFLSPKRVEHFRNSKLLEVSCGGSFTVVIVQLNKSSSQVKTLVYSWGVFENGRLGIGITDELKKTVSHDSKNTARRRSILIDRPTQLLSLNSVNVIEISAGSSHALALCDDGAVLAWGNNFYGQCSFIETNDGKSIEESVPSIWDDVFVPRNVPCFSSNNPAQSVAAGHCQSAAIDLNGQVWIWGGKNKVAYQCHRRERSNDTMRYAAKNDSLGKLRIPCLKPRRVDTLSGMHVSKIVLGQMNGAAITQNGEVYLWEGFHAESPCNVPNQPAPAHLIATGVSAIDVSAADGIVFLSSGPTVNIGMKRWLQTVELDQEFELPLQIDRNCCESSTVDCALFIGKQKIMCHQAILSCRSSVFRNLIMEGRKTYPLEKSILAVYLSDIDLESLKAILYYIYTDTLCLKHVATHFMTFNLMFSAEKYSLKRLSQICRKILDYAKRDVLLQQIEENVNSFILPSTIVEDFEKMINDTSTADVRLQTSEGLLQAHKFILSTRSTFFSALMHDPKQEMIITHQLTESHEGVLRILVFMYTGKVISTSRQHIEEDIINAKRYEIFDMQSQCERLIMIDRKTAFHTLKFAILNDLPRLKHAALNFFVSHEDIDSIIGPHLNLDSEFLIEYIKKHRETQLDLPRDRAVKVDEMIKVHSTQKKEDNEIGLNDKVTVSGCAWWILAIVFSAGLVSVLPPGPWVMVLNLFSSAFLFVTVFTEFA